MDKTMNYSSGVWGVGSVTLAQTLPSDRVLWLIARVLLDAAGAFFLVYLLVLGGLTSVAVFAPRSARPTGPPGRLVDAGRGVGS
jgi:hypothetical protein